MDQYLMSLLNSVLDSLIQDRCGRYWPNAKLPGCSLPDYFAVNEGHEGVDCSKTLVETARYDIDMDELPQKLGPAVVSVIRDLDNWLKQDVQDNPDRQSMFIDPPQFCLIREACQLKIFAWCRLITPYKQLEPA